MKAVGTLRGTIKRLEDMLRGLVREHLVQVPADWTDRLNLDRAFVLVNLFRVISVAGINTMVLWAVDFRNAEGHVFLDILFLAGTALYCVLFARGEIWMRSASAAQNATRYIREMFFLVVVLGVIWAALLISMMAVANPAQHALVYAMIVAGMSTAVLVAPLSVAFGFWMPVTGGAFIAMFSNPEFFDPFALVCLVSYSFLTGFCAIYLNNKLTERAISTIRIEEHGEVIKLLLRDFEESASDWLWETNATLQLQPVSARLAQVVHKRPEDVTGTFPAGPAGRCRAVRAPGRLARLSPQKIHRGAFALP